MNHNHFSLLGLHTAGRKLFLRQRHFDQDFNMDNSARTRRQRSFIEGEIKVAFISNHFFFFTRENNGVPAATSRHTIFAFIIPVIVGFLQIMFQNKDTSPFQTHPKTMRTATISLLMYCFAYHIEIMFCSTMPIPTYANLVDKIMMFLGSLSLACLASIFSPIEVQVILYVLCFLVLARQLILMVLQWLNQRYVFFTEPREIAVLEEWYICLPIQFGRACTSLKLEIF